MTTKIKIKKRTIEVIIAYCFAVLFLNCIQFSVIINKLIAMGVLIFSVFWVYKCWNNIYLLIMSLFIAYSNYSIVMGIYLDENLRPEYLYPQITDINIYGCGISILFLTMFTLVCIMPKIEKNTINITNVLVHKKNNNPLLFIIVTVLFLAIIFGGYTRSSNARGSSSSIYEYGSILLIVMFYFSGGKKKQKIICGGCCAIYVLTSLINGTRIEALICILIFLLCYFQKGLKSQVLFIGMLVGLILFSVVGTLRGNWELMLNNGWKSMISVLFDNKFVFDTCTHAYFPMLCMVEEFNKYSVGKALHYLCMFILSVFAGQSRIPDGDLIKVVAEKYYHNYGGVTPGFFYVWFSYAGSLVFSLIIYCYIRFISGLKKTVTINRACTVLYIVSSVPRWYLYGPWSLLRGTMICIIIFNIFVLLDKCLFHRKRV